MFDAAIAFMASAVVPYLVTGRGLARTGNVGYSGQPTSGVFASSDGRQVSLGVVQQPQFETLARLVGRADWLADPRFANADLRRQHADEMHQDALRPVRHQARSAVGTSSSAVSSPPTTTPRRARRGAPRRRVRPGGRLRSHGRRRPHRPGHLGAARLRGAHLVRLQGRRRRHGRPGEPRDARAGPARGIGNSFAVGPDGVYIVTDAALYRLAADVDGTRAVQWRTAYANTGPTKSGQTQPGSGTTPTLMGQRYVAITDNDDPIKVVVACECATAGVVCTEPLFAKGASSTDQSLIATDSIIVAENNFGYSSPTATEHGHTTSAGLQRVDVEERRCRTVWRSRESAPSAVPKLSLAAGLLYTYAKPARNNGQDAWYLTALDVRTGATVFRRLGGEGLGLENNYAPITLGPDGTAYLGVLGGIVAWRDAGRPAARGRRRRASPFASCACAAAARA